MKVRRHGAGRLQRIRQACLFFVLLFIWAVPGLWRKDATATAAIPAQQWGNLRGTFRFAGDPPKPEFSNSKIIKVV